MERRSLLGAAALAVPAVAGATLVGEVTGVSARGASAATAATTSVVPNDAPPAVGVQFHGTWEMYWDGMTPNAMFHRHLDALGAHGVQVVRVDVGWSAAQPTNAAPDPNQWYHKRLAIILDAVHARKMKAFFTVHQSPAWSRPNTGSNTRQYPTNPDSIKPWLTFLASHFGPKLVGIEIWNEPNLAEFTGVTDEAARTSRYVALLKAAHTAIKAGNPNVPVVFGGPSQTDDVFLRSCYQAGARDYFDIMALHPYQGNQTKPPESTDITGKSRITNMGAVVALMAEYGDSTKPIWWSEFGISVHSNEGINQVWLYGVPSDEVAASYYLRTFFLAWREYPQVKLGVAYCAYKEDTDPHQYGFRLLDADGTAHQQLIALRALRWGFGSLQQL